MAFGKAQIEAARAIREMEEREKKRREKKINEKKNKILNCPCCGNVAYHHDSFGRNTIECPKCGLTTPVRNSKEDCLKIWNTRKN